MAVRAAAPARPTAARPSPPQRRPPAEPPSRCAPPSSAPRWSTASGRTLYLFEKDKTTASTCDGACASVWPPLTTNGKPQAQAGISAAKLGTTKRNDGKVEVTYAGHPLYYYVSDTEPGQLSGEGLDQFGATWDAVAPSGKGIDKD